MATAVVPLAQLKLATGPEPTTAEQRYWKSFRNAKSHTTTAAWSVTHISYPVAAGSIALLSATASKANDMFAVTAGPRVDLYSIRKREALKSIGRFEAVARSGEIRADGRVLVAGDDSGKMQVFDVSGGSRPVILKTWHVHRQPTWVTKWSPTNLTTLMSASDDKTVRLWDLPSSDAVRTFVGHQDYVRSGAFMPTGGGGAGSGSGARGGHGGSSSSGGSGGGHMLVTGSYDATVRLWDARTPGGAVLTFKHAAPVEAVLPMPSGTVILAAAENSVSVLDVVAARPLQLLTSHQKTVTSLCLASGGERVLSGGLDGHVKVYETGTWQVVAGARYSSPVLSVAAVAAGAAGEARHLAVGMSWGVLSIKTRLTGAAAERDRERQREAAARSAGTLDRLDASKNRTKQLVAARKRLEQVGSTPGSGSGDFVINPTDDARGKKETAWQKDLRHQRFAAALDTALDPSSSGHSSINTLTLLVALQHRSALRDALENRDEVSVQPILKWACRHIVDPRYTAVCTDVGLHLLDLYAEYAAASTELHDGFQTLWRTVRREVEQAQLACQTRGMVENLMMNVA
ncbi:small nucleolar ribonucleoprotein complex subunit [Grosmannia clavigera kw1407]|uniref:Small nucleolar ribonucleoprotein complex subunit n=1 Tax=Grosmannia clavigera (strain kw1407 / UAMH 11150) TaxID=655863 RepID=F0XHC0_GROCL|nr:small nucleolar ribonucleoprotein complex subunit [Grosmannia clavigera kw1407]EFX03231.1 small nucleolar ribonucleoprotein complex subunit [Grosmannia clavigera kw1407]